MHEKERIIIPDGNVCKPKIFEPHEAQKLLDATQDNYLLHAIIYFAFETGLRRGEELGLQWPKIRDDGLVKVDQQLKKIGNKFEIVDTLKSKDIMMQPSHIKNMFMPSKVLKRRRLKSTPSTVRAARW